MADMGREERIALTEAAFRIANDRMAAWGDEPAGAAELYYCECAMFDCHERVRLTRDQYEAVRARSDRFFVVTGHELPDVESVVETHDGYNVIEKPDGCLPLLTAADPRTAEDGPARADAERLADEIDS
jgi:hypothetical protein